MWIHYLVSIIEKISTLDQAPQSNIIYPSKLIFLEGKDKIWLGVMPFVVNIYYYY
jgi:hypothetical protein